MKSQKSQWKEPSWWSDSFISSKLENFREQTTQKKTLDSRVLPNQCSVQLSPSNGFGFFVSSTKTLACCNPRMWRTARRGLKERGVLRLLRAALCSRGKGDSDGWAKHLYYNLSRGREEESQACSQNQKEPKAPRFRKRWEERPSEGQLMRAWPLGAKARLCVQCDWLWSHHHYYLICWKWKIPEMVSEQLDWVVTLDSLAHACSPTGQFALERRNLHTESYNLRDNLGIDPYTEVFFQNKEQNPNRKVGADWY